MESVDAPVPRPAAVPGTGHLLKPHPRHSGHPSGQPFAGGPRQLRTHRSRAGRAGRSPYRAHYRQLAPLLRQQLAERGYHESQQPELRVYYWLALQDAPLEFRVDEAPPSPLGGYQAIHRLRDATGTLRLRITDLTGQVLWEGTASTGLSPAWDSAELLQTAVEALVRQIPVATAGQAAILRSLGGNEHADIQGGRRRT